MLKRGSFIKNKYRKLMACNLLTWGSYGLNVMIDALVGGNQLGETALTAVSIVSPILSVILFCSDLFEQGFSYMFGKRIGEFDDEGATNVASLDILSEVAISAIMIIILVVLKNPFLVFFECTGELYQQASIYYNWMLVLVAICPVSIALSRLIVTDGDGLFSMAGSVAQIVLNILLSVTLCRKFGIAGLGMATCVSTLASILFYCCHFFLKTNSIHFKLYWSWKDLKEAFVLSFSCSLDFIFIAVVDAAINKVILVTSGMSMVPAYSAINLALNMFFIFGAPFDSCIGFFTTYLGEKNNYGINNTMRMGAKGIIHIGIIMTLICFFGAPFIPKIYGMTTPDVATASIQAMRIMSISAIPFGFAFVWSMLYPALNKPMFGLFVAALYDLFCPLLLSVPLAFFYGFNGVAVGMSLSSFLVVILFVLFVRKKYGKEGFPLYLEDYNEEVVAFDIRVNENEIVLLRDKVVAELTQHGYYIDNIGLLIEELYTRIMEKNKNKKILSECTLLFGEDQVRIIIRDNGIIFNFVDENNAVESLNSHVLDCLLEHTEEKNYILTTSFNRNGFNFKK